ncbi:MAG: 16S rRNA (cytidine(1402)-2'-O)-methyltransferase [Clostridium sp.]|nr:16S rRNA (cytidine(1402)-2'-O)-methyltransferase [Clostridium sp.]MCI7444299.1 16S rRNA (cytidine(1402)-2'-O)-methyltransferase [Clostridium sp.]
MNLGKLYLVPTPIGNLKDITLRALEVLKFVDIVAAEDTRQTLKLLNHFEIKKSLMSYHKHNEQEKSEDIIELLKEGRNIAIVTDAGTPGISDPGAVIVKKCINENIDFEVLPGATAITTALVYSGLDTTRFLFRGFIPRENKERKILLNEIKDVKESIILYESPYRVVSTLETLLEYLGNRNVAICRELTKLHEEIKRGKIDELIDYFKNTAPKGEFVLVIEGKQQEHIDKENKEKWENLSIKDHILSVMESGISKKEAIKYVAKERGLSKNEVYKYAIDI